MLTVRGMERLFLVKAHNRMKIDKSGIMVKLNLGCGNAKINGYVNIDIQSEIKPDIICDLAHTALPFSDNSVDEIVSCDFLEHLGWEGNNDHLIFILNECWRVLKPEGKAIHNVPRYPHIGAIRDPTHRRFFVPETFAYFLQNDEYHLYTKDLYGAKGWSKIDITATEDRIIVEMVK